MMKNLVISILIIVILLVNTVHGQRASCSAYPKCSKLTGNCCPTSQGEYLDCCGVVSKPVPKVVIRPSVLKPIIKPVPQVVIKPVSKPIVNTVRRRCLAHAKCKPLTGFCCPTSQGVYLSCCPKTKRYLSHQQEQEQSLDQPLSTTEDEKSNIEVQHQQQDVQNETPIRREIDINNRILSKVVDAKCSSTPTCSKLTGNCCPTSAGKYLDCCKSSTTTKANPKKSSNRSCSANSKCKKFTGNCCPTNAGVYLSCC